MPEQPSTDSLVDESRSATVDRLNRAVAMLRSPYLCNWSTPNARALADWLDAHSRDLAGAGTPLAVDSPGDLYHAIKVARALLNEPASRPGSAAPTRTDLCSNCNGTGTDAADHGLEGQPAEVHPCGYCGGQQ